MAVNTGSVPDTAYVIVTPEAANCTGLPDTLTIIVYPMPALIPTDTLRVCAVADLTVAVPADASLMYAWYRSDKSTVVANPANVAIPEGDTLIFYVQLTDNRGCLSAMTPVVVVGYILPTVTVTHPAIVCEGTMVDLTATVPADASLSYTFYTDDQATVINTPEALMPPVGVTEYYVRATDNTTGCQSLLQEITVTVQGMPTMHIEAEGDTVLCYNTSITMDAVVSHGTPIWVGWWDANGLPDNTLQFAPDPHAMKVVYEPLPSEAGRVIKLFARVRDKVCGYLPYDTIYLRILPTASAASIEFVTQPVGYQEICTDTIYEVKIKSADEGDLDNLQLMLHDYKATGLTIKDAYIKHPYTASSWQPLNDFTSAQTNTVWRLPNSLQHTDSILVKVVVRPECDFFSGADIVFQLNTSTVCGDPLPETMVYTEEFHIVQDTAQLNSYELISEFVSHPANKISNNTSDTVTWRITAVVHGDHPTNEDTETVVFLIPDGLHYVLGSYVKIKNAPDLIGDDYTQINDAGYITNVAYLVDEFGVEYGLHIPSGLTEANKDSIIFELKFYTEKGYCMRYEFYTEIIYTDSVECAGQRCVYHSSRGGAYPELEIERYRFNIGAIAGEIVNGYWYGSLNVTMETETFAGDSLFVRFYTDKNNNSLLDATDEQVRLFNIVTAGFPEHFVLPLTFDSIPVEQAKQLIGAFHSPALCDTIFVILGTVTGVDTLCQNDTSLYYTANGQHLYKWNVDLPPDAVSGSTPVRIPLEGSVEDNYLNESMVRILWKKRGDYKVWTQYLTDDGTEIDKVSFPVHVAESPVLELTGGADTAICNGMPMELTHFFRETTGMSVTMAYYRENADGSLTLLPGASPLLIYPDETAIYRAVATSVASGCTAMTEFSVEVATHPEITDIDIIEQPDCSIGTGSIIITVTGGSGAYEYSLNDTSAYRDLIDGIPIEGLPEGAYNVFVRDKQGGCPVVVSDTVEIAIVPEPTGIGFAFVAQPLAYQEFCTDTVYEVKIKAIDAGDLSHIRLTLADINANRLSVKSAQMKQPYLSGTWTPLTDVASLLAQTTWTLPSPLESGDSLLVQITVAAECDFYSGANLALYLNATTLCDTPLPEDTLYTEPYRIMQDTVTMNTYEISSTFSRNSISGHDEDTVTWRLKAVIHGTRPTDNVRESMVALVPAGMNAVPGSYKAVRNAPAFDPAQLELYEDIYGKEYGFRVPGGLTDGDSIIVELQFEASEAPCDDYRFYAKIIYTDSAYCQAVKCAYNVIRGSVYPNLSVERQAFSVDSVYGWTKHTRWNGDIYFLAKTDMLATDTLYVELMVDRDNNSVPSAADTIALPFVTLSVAVAAQDTFARSFSNIYVEPQTQLLALITGTGLCYGMQYVIPIAVITGANNLCATDTALFYTAADMQNYEWGLITPVGIAEQDKPYRIPLEGSSAANYANENAIRMVFPAQGAFTLWTYYTQPDTQQAVYKTYFPLQVGMPAKTSIYRRPNL
jgi:hypothetical protein